MNRVHGTETEWSVRVEAMGSTPDEPKSKELEASCFKPYVEAYLADKPYVGTPADSCYLENGSRFYADIGHKRETTTPEDTSYLSTTASEIANERMMFDILSWATYPDPGQDGLEPLPNFALNKRVIGDDNVAWGYHESYNVPANIPITEEGLALYGLHIATRNIFCGAGFLDTNGKFWSSQKALSMRTEFSGNTTSSRPVINARDEPHSNTESKRIHTISGDPSMSPWVTRMQLGTTSLVLELLAQGTDAGQFAFEALRHKRLAKFMRDLAADSSGQSHEFSAALEVQKKFVQMSKKLSLTEEQEWTVDEWEHICYDLGNNLAVAGNRVEWILQRRILERYQEKHAYVWTDLAMRQQDRRFCRIGDNSIGLSLRETAWSEWMPPESLIQERRTEAPQTTRAAIRSKFIKAFSRLNGYGSGEVAVDWKEVKYNGASIKLADPYATADERVDELIASHASNSQVAA
jgi:proteasome accessory factor A